MRHLERLEQLHRVRERAKRLLRDDPAPASLRELVLEVLGEGEHTDGHQLDHLEDHQILAEAVRVPMTTLDDWRDSDLATKDLAAEWPVALAHVFGLAESTFLELITHDLHDDRASDSETETALDRFRAEWGRIREFGMDTQ